MNARTAAEQTTMNARNTTTPASGLIRMFEQSQLPLFELPALRELLKETVADCATSLRDIAGAELSISLKTIKIARLNATMAARTGTLCSLFLIPEWNAQAVVSYSTTLLFQLLDAMYGGEITEAPDISGRVLTQLERNIAGQFAGVMLDQLKKQLNQHIAIGPRLVTVEQLTDASPYEKNATEYMLIHLAVGATEDQIMMALPLKGLELIRDRLTASSEESTHDLDPSFRRQFQVEVGHSNIELMASCAIAPMTLAEVASLRIGSFVEFDASSLQAVTIEAAEKKAFRGRLGQSRGFFTICVEAPLRSDRSEEGEVVAAYD